MHKLSMMRLNNRFFFRSCPWQQVRRNGGKQLCHASLGHGDSPENTEQDQAGFAHGCALRLRGFLRGLGRRAWCVFS